MTQQVTQLGGGEDAFEMTTLDFRKEEMKIDVLNWVGGY